MASATRRQQYGDAVEKLKKYINGTSSEDFVSLVLTGQTEVDANTTAESISPEIKELKSIVSPIIDVINGGYFTHELLTKFETILNSNNNNNNSSEILAKSIRISPQTINDESYTKCFNAGILHGAYSYQGISDGIKSIKRKFILGNFGNVSPDINNPSKTKTNISIIEILNSQLGTAVRDTAGLTIFTSAIPAHIISRAVPYVSVKVHGVKGYENNQGISKSENLSLLRYLKGKYEISPENIFDTTLLGFNNSQVTAPVSMEAFTAPQTLVADLSDPNISRDFVGVNPVDKFRPLMTLTSITFDVASSGAGFISFKTGKINLVLHDRGRLSEVAAFVQAQLYSIKELEIEYGWSIDTSSGRLATDAEIASKLAERGQRVYGGRVSDDVFAQFVDSLRVTEKYIIVNSEFSFDDVGQVNIGLSISLKGGKEIEMYDVSSDFAKDAKNQLKSAITNIGNFLSQGNLKDVLSESFLGAVSSEDSVLALNPDDIVKLNETINKISKKNKNSSQIGELSSLIDDILSTSANIQSDLQGSVDKMFSNISDITECFFASRSIINSQAACDNPNAGLEAIGLSSNDYTEGSISLGRALAVFICQPLQEQKRFDEIQLIFNKFNDRASFMRSMSIAAFPLDKKKLIEAVKNLYTKRTSVSVSQVINLVGSFIESINHPAYGFSGAYDKDGKLKEEGGLSVVETQLKKAGILDSKFQLPKLSVNFECVPHWKNRDQTILRIHVTDSQASPFQEHCEAITAGRSDVSRFVEIGAIDTVHPLFIGGPTPNDLDSSYILKQRKNVFEKMTRANVLEKVINKPAISNPTDVFYSIDLSKFLKVSRKPNELKNFLKRGLPSINYGNAGGLVKSISVSSINDARLATVNILRAQESGADSPALSRQSGLPLLVNGTEVQVEMLGCPILNFGQSFYIDMGTNTSVDNIYVCTGLSHKIEPGQFSTSAKFTLNVGAYGIYSSAKREFAVLGSIARNLAIDNDNTATPAGVPSKAYSIFGVLKLTSIINPDLIGTELKKAGIQTIRVWRNQDGNPYTLRSIKGVKFLGNDDSIQINKKPAIKEIFELLRDNTQISCYEFALPTASNKNNDIIEGKLTIANPGDRSDTLVSQYIEINLENLPELIKKAPKPARPKMKPKPVSLPKPVPFGAEGESDIETGEDLNTSE